MRAAPIPDECVWAGAVRRVIAPPGGDLTDDTIAPCEALIERAVDGIPLFSMRCVLEDDDLEKLKDGGVVWLTLWGHVVPFALSVSRADNS